MLAGLDDDTPAGAALIHSHPLWITERWWHELGPAEARGADALRQRAGRERRARESDSNGRPRS